MQYITIQYNIAQYKYTTIHGKPFQSIQTQYTNAQHNITSIQYNTTQQKHNANQYNTIQHKHDKHNTITHNTI